MKYCSNCYKNNGLSNAKYPPDMSSCPRCGSRLIFLDISRDMYTTRRKNKY